MVISPFLPWWAVMGMRSGVGVGDVAVGGGGGSGGVGRMGFLVEHGVDQGHGDGGHAERFPVARAGEDHVFHASAAQAFGGLFAEHPTDGVA